MYCFPLVCYCAVILTSFVCVETLKNTEENEKGTLCGHFFKFIDSVFYRLYNHARPCPIDRPSFTWMGHINFIIYSVYGAIDTKVYREDLSIFLYAK